MKKLENFSRAAMAAIAAGWVLVFAARFAALDHMTTSALALLACALLSGGLVALFMAERFGDELEEAR